jgi:hypothetical protein
MSATNQIDRRKLMVSGAIGAAALTVAAVPAFADEDTELMRLWEEWKPQYACWVAAAKYACDVEEKVSNDSWRPYWKLDEIYESHAMPHPVPEGSLHARFNAFDEGKPIERFDKIEATSVQEASDRALAMAW